MKDADQLAEWIRESLDRGGEVDIEGLGTFRKSGNKHAFTAERQPQVFIAYVHEDLPRARKLCESLREAGCAPWLDKDKLLPGQNWPRSIERAIASSDSFVACFSPRALIKRGQFQSELRYALDCARHLPLDSVFLIPVRFERCEIPRGISDQVQYVDLFPDWERGIQRAVHAIRKAARRRPITRLS